MIRPLKKGRTPSKARKSAVDENRDQKRAYILKAAASLFARYGYQATTMDHIADATKLNKGTIYYYYKSKADMLFSMCYECILRNLDYIGRARTIDDPVEAIRCIVSATVETIIANRDINRIYWQEISYFPDVLSKAQNRIIDEEQRTVMGIYRSAVKKGIESGVFTVQDARIGARLMAGLMHWVTRFPEDKLDAAKTTEAVLGMVLGGLRGAGAR